MKDTNLTVKASYTLPVSLEDAVEATNAVFYPGQSDRTHDRSWTYSESHEFEPQRIGEQPSTTSLRVTAGVSRSLGRTRLTLAFHKMVGGGGILGLSHSIVPPTDRLRFESLADQIAAEVRSKAMENADLRRSVERIARSDRPFTIEG